MAFCEFCGKEIPEGQKCDCPQAAANEQPSISLSKESAPQNESTPFNNNVQNDVTAQNIPAEQPADADGTAAKKTKGLGLVIVAVIVLIAAVFVISALPKSYQKPIDKFYKGIVSDKSQYVIEAMFDERMLEDSKSDMDDLCDSLEKSSTFKNMADNLEERYGKHAKISYTIEKAKEIKKKNLDDYEELYESCYNLSCDITKGYELTLETTIKGKKRDSQRKHSFVVVQIKDSGWKICGMYPEYVVSGLSW